MARNFYQVLLPFSRTFSISVRPIRDVQVFSGCQADQEGRSNHDAKRNSVHDDAALLIKIY